MNTGVLAHYKFTSGISLQRRKIRLIEGNAKCRHLKKLTCKRTCGRSLSVWGPAHTPPPLTHTCIRVYSVRICRPFKEFRNRFPAGRAGMTILLSDRPARQHRLAESIPRYRFLGSINDYKYVLTTLIHTWKWGWVEPKRRLEGQQFIKLGRIYQHDWLYLQSINSDKHLLQSPFPSQFFYMMTFCFDVYKVN
jgi:hypothetical protein